MHQDDLKKWMNSSYSPKSSWYKIAAAKLRGKEHRQYRYAFPARSPWIRIETSKFSCKGFSCVGPWRMYAVRGGRGGGGRARSVLPEPRKKIAFRSESRGTRRSKLISLIRFPCNSESKEVHFGPLKVSIMGGGGGGSKVTTVYRQYNW